MPIYQCGQVVQNNYDGTRLKVLNVSQQDYSGGVTRYFYLVQDPATGIAGYAREDELQAWDQATGPGSLHTVPPL